VKKYASLLAVFVLLLGIASIGYSAPAEIPADTSAVIAKGRTQITLGGELRFRGMYGKNLDVDLKSDGDNRAYYDYRIMLDIEAKVSPNTTGFIQLQSGPYGDYTADNTTWGSYVGGARGVYNNGNTIEADLRIRQGWIQYQGTGLLGVPAGVKVGRQLVKLGYGLFYDHTYFGDDAILAFVQPMKELTLAAAHIKWSEGNINSNDDATGWVLLGAYAGKGFGLSADVSYVDHQNIGLVVPGTDIHLWNFGLRGNVDDIAGTGLNFKADVEFQTGKLTDTGSDDPKFKGWAFMAGLDYKFKTMPLGLTLEYAIGSGDKADSNDINAFITALGQEQHYTFVYEYLVKSACNFLNTARTGLCNTQYVKLGGAYDITKDLKAELYGYWLRAHRAVAINGYSETSKKLGWEVDAKVTYNIDKGLTYFVEGGYFWPGKAYKLASDKDADDAWAVRHGITLKF
jgi:hypothetical protein